jgi:excisionase family DNA binding protein
MDTGWIQIRPWHMKTNLLPGTLNALNKRNPSGFLQRGSAGWTGLEPAASGVTGHDAGLAGDSQASQIVGISQFSEPDESNPLQQNAGFSQSFAAHLLPGSGDTSRSFLRVCDVAKRLGVSRSSVYALCAQGELRHVRVMNCIRVAQSDLTDFLKSRRSGCPTVRPAEGR